MSCPFFSDDICLIPDNGMYIPLSIHKEHYCMARYTECVRYKQYQLSGRSEQEDRRKYTRTRKIVPCATQTSPEHPNCFTVDVSLGGMRVMVADSFIEGECYDFWLFGEDKKSPMNVTACVRWTRPSFLEGWYEVGLAFTPSVYEEHKDKLLHMVTSK